jgi:Holliday junction resolvase RusA-like endonuclease
MNDAENRKLANEFWEKVGEKPIKKRKKTMPYATVQPEGGTMTEQIFEVLGIPTAQGRPRFARMGNFVKTYDPKESRENKNNIRAQVVTQHPLMIARDKPVLCHVQAYLPRPKAHYGKKGLKGSAPMMHISRPDSDNIMKAIKDALSGVCWQDDCQVCDERIIKLYGEVPKTIITVREL